ncbi:DNA polymerase III subunit beta [Aliterella atlantica]|uniref:Beta sliding clamp n=1 Tax=Aliterella atlantica CENA595 TaxID=1618023 RepID=A0A0D8ZN29_9CYAN|nr:DNA polymerase III subunit beta [Aliterella atlantica]KJH69874.1 DNA polymerase III subunit beta [Aliterella atlantica CENA595]
MKLVCNQTDLNAHLSLVSRAVPSRPTHPILANVLLIANAQTQQLSLTAFDLSLGIKTSFNAEVEVGGEIALPAKLMGDIVSRLPAGEIRLEQTQEGALGVSLISASGRYQVRGMEVDEFPELPVIEEGEAIYLPVEALMDGLRSALFATSSDDTKQILTGLHLTVKQDSLEFAATDGHRLAVVETTNTGDAAAGLEVTVPARSLRELERMLGIGDATEPLAMHQGQGQIIFEWAEQRLTSRILEGQYPAYRQLIPRQFERQITLERKQLLSALERIAVMADQKNNIVKFSIDSLNEELSLSVEAQDVGSGRESIKAQISGEDLDFAFNIKYLMDGLKALPTNEITMEVNTATSPIILTPLGSLKMTYLIMPVQIRT